MQKGGFPSPSYWCLQPIGFEISKVETGFSRGPDTFTHYTRKIPRIGFFKKIDY